MTTTSSPFSADFLKKIQGMLTEQKTNLERELKSLNKPEVGSDETHDGIFPNYGNTEEDNAQEVADYETNLGIENQMDRTYRDVVKALARLKEGTYGICRYCKKPIDEKRLMARPTSSACIECKKTIVQEV